MLDGQRACVPAAGKLAAMIQSEAREAARVARHASTFKQGLIDGHSTYNKARHIDL